MSEVFDCNQQIYNFQHMVRKLEDFCKDLPIDLYASYVYDTASHDNEYNILIADFEAFNDKIKFYIESFYYPETDICRVFFCGHYEGYYEDLKNSGSILEKSYSPTNNDCEIKSMDDIYELIIEHIKKGIPNYEG